MAGYGDEIEVPASYDELVRALLQAAQRRGRRLGLVVRYRHRPLPGDRSAWMLTADGAGVIIAAWVHQLERDLPVVAEGFTGPGSGTVAVRIGHSLPARWVELLVGDHLPRVASAVITTRIDVARVFWPILNPPDLGRPLADRLQLADGLIGRWIVDDLPDESGLEELHTAIEIVLRTVLSAGKNARFPQLLSRAREGGLIGEDDHDALTRLNEHRRVVKHHGGVIPEEHGEVVKADLWSAVAALDQLQSHLERVRGAEEH